jgi:hypothetical protein
MFRAVSRGKSPEKSKVGAVLKETLIVKMVFNLERSFTGRGIHSIS